VLRLLVLTTILLSSPLFAAQPAERPVRTARRFSIAFTAEAVLLPHHGDDPPAIPLVGLQLSFNLHPNFSLDLAYRTIGFPNYLDLGARYFILKHVVTPYLYLRGGVLLYSKAEGNLSGGAGVELSTRCGFNLFLDGGVESYFAKTDTTCGGRVGLGIGYRF